MASFESSETVENMVDTEVDRIETAVQRRTDWGRQDPHDAFGSLFVLEWEALQ